MADDGIGDAAEQDPLKVTEAVASHDHESRVQLLGEPHDLRVRAADLRVNRRDLAAIIPYLRRFLAEPLLGVVFDFLQVVLGVRGVERTLGYTVYAGCGLHVDEVHLRADLAGQLGRHTSGATGFRGTVGGQQDFCPKRAQGFLLALRTQ